MKRYLLTIATLLSATYGGDVLAATDTLFRLPDTVCAGHHLIPELLYTEGRNYEWSFCSPQYNNAPTGVNLGKSLHVYSPTDLKIRKDDKRFVGFLVNSLARTEGLVRWVFEDGIDNPPIATRMFDVDETLPNSPSGVEVVEDSDGWHVFVIGGSNAATSGLTRYTLSGRLNSDFKDTMKFGNLGGALISPKKLNIVNDNGNYYGFTFNNGRELVRLDFGNKLSNTPTTTNFGNIDNLLTNASSITMANESGNWYLFVTDRVSGKLIRFTFGADLTALPFAIDYDNLDNNLLSPVGYALAGDCMDNYGFMLNSVGSHLIGTYYNGSITESPTAKSHGNIGATYQPTAMTQFITDSVGNKYIFALNSDSTASRIKYVGCSSASTPGSNQKIPNEFFYTTPGTYTVFLTVDDGTENKKTYCKDIVITAGPDVTSSDDYHFICEGDTVKLQVNYAQDLRIKWEPAINISDVNNKTVFVYPQFDQKYTSTVSFRENCVFKKTYTIDVGHATADAGGDRKITDGSDITLGGSLTSIGEEFTYRWFPTDFFTSSNNNYIATARPEQSITYYLEVLNQNGCKDIDSVNITVGCTDISLPNAFVPYGKTNETGFYKALNQQIVKLVTFNIFDRWGQLVFSTIDPKVGWDGTTDGKEAPLGVYVYEIDGFCLDGTRIRKTGNVTLIR